ncbi:MAG: TolC family protein [Deltaproteobacteria bacterium]|nr:TolC family protein [Deltaproteobacteria bacterium]HDZ91175.1 TolC family protein [Deltaproteobacteria bacterium]
MAFSHLTPALPGSNRVCGRGRIWNPAGVLCLAMALAVLFAGCRRPRPELEPDKFVSPAPGKPFHVSKETEEFFPKAREKLLGLADEPVPSGSTYTLPQLLDVALSINPATREAWAMARAAAAGWGAARGSYYPTIGANLNGAGGRFAQTSALGAFKGVSGEVGLSLSYLLLDFGGREATAESARQALMAANWNHNQAIQDLLRDVPQTYYRYLGNKARVRASEVSLNEALTSLRSTEQRRKAGVSTIADVLQARSKADQVRLTLVADRGAMQVARGELARAVGWPANAVFEIAGEQGDIPLDKMQKNTEELIELAVRDRPDLRAAQAAVRQGRAELRKAEAELWPKLFATGNAGWTALSGRIPGQDISENASNYYGGLSLQIPIFEGFSLRNRVREAKANLEEARASLRSKIEEVAADVWIAYYRMHTAAQQVETSETLLESSRESYRVSLARYRAGAADIVELLNAQSQLESARAQEVEARTDLLVYYADLLHAIGADLPTEGVSPPYPPGPKGEETPDAAK